MKNYIVNLSTIKTFDSEQNQILKNGFNLALNIKNKLKVDSLLSLSWYGYDAGKVDPYDIQINDFFFSLKEESFMSENM